MGNIYLNPLSTRSAGQAILLKQNREIIEHIILLHGRIQVLKLKISETILTLVNVYGPNHETDRVPFLDKLQNILSCYDYGDEILIGGDFNFVLNEDMDKFSLSKPKNFKKSTSQIKFENIMSSFELVDIWRKRNENKRRYTWSQPNPNL